MSIILGINSNHADSSACIIKNGELLFAIEEERINRVKHWAGLPCGSIEACLKYTNIDLSDITDIAINTNPLSNLHHKMIYFVKNYLLGKKKFEIADRLKKKLSLKKDINNFFNPKSLTKNVNIHFIDHHVSHIASAFFPSNFKKAVGLSIDGFGDFCSVSIAKCENEKIHIVKKEFFPNSLGVFYESFTQLIGFKNYGDEYKMMGLSSYGEPKYFDEILKNLFNGEKGINLNLKYFNHTNKNYSYKFQGKPEQNNLFSSNLKNLFNVGDLDTKSFSDLQKDLASSAQKVFEYKLFEIINEVKSLNYSDNLVYAGGCALNSLANKKLHESNLFKNIFIPYAPGDGGGSIGAALYALKENKNITLSNLTSPFIGPNFSNDEIKKVINSSEELNKFNFQIIEDKNKLYSIIAKYIFDNKIVGHFNGKMEFGARALGNRSILANPCNPNIKDIINSKIKRRESFRPFAPAILYENKNDWFENTKLNEYMSSVEKISESKRKIIPGVTHIDGTGRVQTVTENMNSDFYLLIKKFYDISSVPIILNTSFNENEPIVMSPKEAINCFLRTDMDILVLNNYIIKR